jgi:hypothetical protein
MEEGVRELISPSKDKMKEMLELKKKSVEG